MHAILSNNLLIDFIENLAYCYVSGRKGPLTNKLHYITLRAVTNSDLGAAAESAAAAVASV